MERLTERFENGQVGTLGCGNNCKYNYRYCDDALENCPTIAKIFEKLANYEDAEEQGLLLRLPCKVGDTIYEVYYENRKYIIREHVVNQFVYISYREPRIEIYCERENGFLLSSITGKLDEGLFLTREEAEAKLKEMEENNND